MRNNTRYGKWKKQHWIDTYNLTEEQFDELEELLENTPEYEGWNRPELMKFNDSVIMVSGLFFDSMNKVKKTKGQSLYYNVKEVA